ncbi:tRNA (adenosine(37)-N6)-threonylcarbamoyltransferase complex dimerization subunit type 1 TsaB [Candidatus Purcelliella pentastirinorum]|uniref:tRNA (adenosine(37)-N6)-threonylcarbamoyltransferase complex dimerization subunit type 1 TsaB n=1 Tax=Candidatus Purcelliella pentastirinorum TaxID=472834 RepID=UPI0023687A16|nr:tRNA (adenosine(37)-N6)-threonylcarbamoyltransferase complex dimerization subunit type 1 TsaB [Candidatus Purcelliella pentastirinorum]WDI78969.1 tRNA (adenosine(37)-N6)-threonylcarbamoyltransferase complex dimerization subunit type 1 TsaB [Candidatus Purcelliella pentastirinorum]WDR80105.1 tRNA (adenosine(37)-N6)-threonylcarbamoyltransferase complex dimerization subunit type 1 TsaB [Candidatus Purcelliella pentastirinorum]
MNTILSIDTSFNVCSVSLLKNNKINTIYKKTKNNHAKFILFIINKILLDNNLKIDKLNVIAINIGPGNFTSLRIGINVSQSLSLALNIPIVVMSSMLIVAEEVYKKYKKKKVLILINAKFDKFYFASYILDKYKKMSLLGNEIIISSKELLNILSLYDNSWVAAGNGWKIFFNILKDFNLNKKVNFKKINIYLPSSKNMIYIALNLFKLGKLLLPENIVPNYLFTKIPYTK